MCHRSYRLFRRGRRAFPAFPSSAAARVIGELDAALLSRSDANGVTVADAHTLLRGSTLRACAIAKIAEGALGYLEFHIERRGQCSSPGGCHHHSRYASYSVLCEPSSEHSRLELRFEGHANHARTTPMHLHATTLWRALRRGSSRWSVTGTLFVTWSPRSDTRM